MATLTVSDIAAELESAALFEQRVLRSLQEQPERARVSVHEHLEAITERRIHALEFAAAAFRGFQNLPAPLQLSLGVLPGEVR